MDAEKDSDAAFDGRVDQVLREVGERGKPIVAESVPPETKVKRPVRAQAAPAPTREPAAVPAPPLEPEPIPEPSPSPSLSAEPKVTPTTLTTPDHTLTPAVQHLHHSTYTTPNLAQSCGRGVHGEIAGSSLAEVAVFMRDQQQMHMERDAKLEVRLESQLQQSEQQRREAEAKLERFHAEAVELRVRAAEGAARNSKVEARNSKVELLQYRLGALYDAKLLEDEELSTIEDKVADAIGAESDEEDDKWELVMKMIKLSEGIPSEKMFARQLKRKFVHA